MGLSIRWYVRNSVSQTDCMYSVMLWKVSWSLNCLLKTLTLKGCSSVCTLWGKNTNDLNPLHRNITIHILHTVPCTITKLLTRRICLTIKSFFSCRSVPLLVGRPTIGLPSGFSTKPSHVQWEIPQTRNRGATFFPPCRTWRICRIS